MTRRSVLVTSTVAAVFIAIFSTPIHAADANGELVIPEYLRVWGRRARSGDSEE